MIVLVTVLESVEVSVLLGVLVALVVVVTDVVSDVVPVLDGVLDVVTEVVIVVDGVEVWQMSTVPSCRGLFSSRAFFKSMSLNLSVLTMITPPCLSAFRLVTSAAGFMATNTSERSPGVKISLFANCSWKPETPSGVPAGARISAG